MNPIGINAMKIAALYLFYVAIMIGLMLWKPVVFAGVLVLSLVAMSYFFITAPLVDEMPDAKGGTQ